MLRFFFHPDSWVVGLVNILALGEVVWLIYKNQTEGLALGVITLFIIFSWFIFNLLHWINWYPGIKGRRGIRIHFHRNIVWVAYLSFLALGLKGLGFSEWAVLPFAVALVPAYYLNLTLLYFHFRDTSPMEPNYFSHNFYLGEKEES